MLAVACVAAPLAIAAVWLRAQVLDTHAYVKTVTPLSSNPAIDSAVAGQITTALFANLNAVAEQQGLQLGSAQLASLHDSARTAVDRFLRTEQFRRIWVVANTQAHDALVAELESKPSRYIGPDGSIVLDLTDAVAAARQILAGAGLQAFDNVDPALLQRRLVIAQPHSLDRLRQGVRILKALTIALPALTIALFVLAFAIPGGRRRTLLWAGLGLAATTALAVAAIAGARSLYLEDVVAAGLPRDAAGALYDAVVRNVRFELEIACAGGLAAFGVAAIAGLALAAVRRSSLA